MFSRFDPASKRVMRAAEQACRNHNHYFVGVGHLLLALLEEGDAAVAARLAARGACAADILVDLRRALGTGDDRLWDGILVTPRFARVLETADRNVTPPGTIGPVDLFDAILAEGGGLTAEFLKRSLGNIREPREVAR